MGQVKWTTITFLQVTIINIMSTLPKTGNTKEFLNDLEQHSKTANKSPAVTLMAKLTAKKFDGKCGIQEHVLETTNLAAQIKS